MATDLSSARRALGRVGDRLQGLAQQLRAIKAELPVPHLDEEEDVDEEMHANEAFRLDLELEEILLDHLEPAIQVLQNARRPPSAQPPGSPAAKA